MKFESPKDIGGLVQPIRQPHKGETGKIVDIWKDCYYDFCRIEFADGSRFDYKFNWLECVQ